MVRKSSMSESNCSDSRRASLRKRKFVVSDSKLGTLPNSSPKICRVQYCGIELKDEESLKWHYESHFEHELSKLKTQKIRVKRSSIPFENWKNLERVRYGAFEKVKFRRETRKALPTTSRHTISTQDSDIYCRCPVCDINIPNDDYVEHLDACLRVETKEDDEEPRFRNDDDFISTSSNDDDSEEGSTFDEYEWAGQRRVRATALFEGGLSGDSGFMTIVPGNEDEVLDIEGDDVGPSQYTESDIVFPETETAEERSERDRLLRALGHNKKDDRVDKDEEDQDDEIVDIESTEIDELKKKIKELTLENEELRNRVVCNVCMDAYEKPLVSLECWHIHCEQCWLRALGTKKLCPQCKVITRPEQLRKVYL